MPTEDFFKRTATFKGLSLNDNVGILTGADVPWNLYTGVPIGSRFFHTNGTEYKKISASDLQAGWAIAYVITELPTPQYVYSPSTVNNATTTYVNIVTLNATTVIGKSYLAKFSGIAKTPTSQGCTIGYFNGATEVTNSGYRINHVDSELCINLTLLIVAVATTTSITLKMKSRGAGSTCSVRNAAITFEVAQ
jgi:hypothetical protein